MPDNFSVTVDELAGSPSIEATALGDIQGKRRWKVGWGDTMTFLGELLGGTEESGDEGSVYTPPARWPDEELAIYVARAGSKPLGGEKLPVLADDASGLPTYSHSVVEATYAVPQFNPDDSGPQTLREERIEFSGEFMNVSNAEMSWTSDGQTPVQNDVTLARMAESLELLVFFPFRAVLPVAAISNAVGTVNASTITAFGGAVSFPSETLLFLPPSARRIVTLGGSTAWQIQFRLSFKFQGWNRFFNPEGGGDGFGRAYRRSGGGFTQFTPHRLNNYLPILQG